MAYTAIVSWDEDNRPTKFANFDQQSAADAHAAEYGGFVVAEDVLSRDWVVDPETQKAIFDREPDPVPARVTALQARRALSAAGLRDSIETWVSGQDQDVRDAWQFGTVVQRTDQLISDAATALGMTEQEVDDLFRDAATR